MILREHQCEQCTVIKKGSSAGPKELTMLLVKYFQYAWLCDTFPSHRSHWMFIAQHRLLAHFPDWKQPSEWKPNGTKTKKLHWKPFWSKARSITQNCNRAPPLFLGFMIAENKSNAAETESHSKTHGVHCHWSSIMNRNTDPVHLGTHTGSTPRTNTIFFGEQT